LEKRGKELDQSAEDIDDSKFALAAFIDETVASSPWKQKGVWLSRTLQDELFDTTNAGEEFFDKLKELQSNPSERTSLLEVYYLCLVLGFEGKYKILGKEQRHSLITEVGHDLKLSKLSGRNILSPKWKRSSDIIREVRDGEIPIWVVLASCFLIGVLLFWVASSRMNTLAEDTKTEITSFINKAN